ncbi:MULTISPECIES: pyridoxamine 5'-phosphate oxidase family protein [Serratia]|uniref:Pyridoxamine 5'-phosphate oxidase n=1 Tax=Serratia liquefaciens TaxID=614 RepID=A0A515CTB0_SERLI|nr:MULTISPECIES: pyridoxamine 5'-phosphate oxidase family protein [Serratia]AKE09850.1 pyridoxamine 5'-phosphate oxidase [Serratia liquefaciens]MBF8105776.1 pyridoxamine 5'-phosphate oxidase family protein [Serratia liquefaciens]MBH2811193.1 pyridoxamine 5'-phosphate oxidase family protein [Serratia liquefaciens]MBV0842632.1 pyridoxamine 5'-phosphate oxidase family protein [Serratia liquefaciens]MCE9940489.1 pyridoxamine 5'-phosphate oxidase family protein [Serratia liquefaciens]
MTQPMFHPDELRAQALAGFDRVGGNIYTSMPEQHREFFAALPYLFVATLDEQGWPVATLFNGPPGFLRTPDSNHLRISAPRRQDDPAQAALQTGSLVGALGLDFSNRRRNRANGHITRTDKNRLEIAVSQSFGNCPQYIQQRELYPVATHPAPIEHLATLDAAAQALIRQADTCFVASCAHSSLEQGGVDISHRGGKPGFIHLQDRSLWIPDFRGNRYMNTLGNLLAEPRAALLFIDFERGDVLHLQGETQILWQAQIGQGVTGAERYWRFDIRSAWRFSQALPWRGRNLTYSPATLSTGVWSQPA